MRTKKRPGQNGNADSQLYRDKTLTIRLNQLEYDDLYSQFHKSKKTQLAGFVRKKLLGKSKDLITAKTAHDLNSLVYDIQRFGNNLNQIARKLNQDKELSLINVEIKKEYENLLKSVLDEIKLISKKVSR